MKKKYVTPDMTMLALNEEDVLTNSPASVLFDGENENDKQWWKSDNNF